MIQKKQVLEDIIVNQQQNNNNNHYNSNFKSNNNHFIQVNNNNHNNNVNGNSYFSQRIINQINLKTQSSSSLKKSNELANPVQQQEQFEKEFPSLLESNQKRYSKKKQQQQKNIHKVVREQQSPLTGSNITTTTTTTTTTTSTSSNSKPPTRPPTPSKTFDVSEGDKETESWKKRDLLYYCFIQRHSEVYGIAEFMDGVSQIYNLPTTQCNLLDVGCGLGRMFSEWESRERWVQVDALEPDINYVEFALNHASNISSKVNVIHGGFHDINIKNKYHFVACVHGPFQYLLTLDDKLEALRRIWRSLLPGGVVFLDVSNFLIGLSNLMRQTEHKSVINGIPVKRVSNIDIDFHNSIWRLEDIFFSVDGGDIDDGEGNGYGDGGYVVENHQFSIYTLPELQLLLSSSGFTNIKSTSRYCAQSLLNGTPIDGPRIILTAQKPLHVYG